MYDEYENAAVTSDESAGTVNEAEEQVGVADTDTQQTETGATEANETNEAEFTDGGADGGNDQPEPEPEKPKKEPQSKERNAEEARKRREAEKQEAIRQARVDAIIEATGGKNPYTGGEITDADDVEEYLNMRRIEKEGKDPLSDYAGWMKQQAKVRKAEQEAKEKQEAQTRDDIDAFRKANPDVDLKELFGDESFSDYAEGKLGNKPLTQIYDGYRKWMSGARKAEQEKAAQALANSRATPGSAAATSTPEATFYTREQVERMSSEERRRKYDIIRKSIDKWE